MLVTANEIPVSYSLLHLLVQPEGNVVLVYGLLPCSGFSWHFGVRSESHPSDPVVVTLTRVWNSKFSPFNAFHNGTKGTHRESAWEAPRRAAPWWKASDCCLGVLRLPLQLGQCSDLLHVFSLQLMMYPQCVNEEHFSKSKFYLSFSPILVISLVTTGHSFEASWVTSI